MLESYIFPSKLTYCPSVAGFVIKGVPNFWAIVSEIFEMGFWYVKFAAIFLDLNEWCVCLYMQVEISKLRMWVIDCFMLCIPLGLSYNE